MTDKQSTQYRFARLLNPDEALRLSLLTLSGHPQYQNLPFRQIPVYYKSIRHEQYLLMLENNQVIGVIIWSEISASVCKECIAADRAPYVKELQAKGDAIYCTAFVAHAARYLRPLWNAFIKDNPNKDILFKRHFRGERRPKPIAMVRNGRRICTSRNQSN